MNTVLTIIANILFFYVFGMAAILLTYYTVTNLAAYIKTRKSKKSQER